VVESDTDCSFAEISTAAYDDVWILDVDGIHLLITSSAGEGATNRAVRAEIKDMMESIEFGR